MAEETTTPAPFKTYNVVYTGVVACEKDTLGHEYSKVGPKGELYPWRTLKKPIKCAGIIGWMAELSEDKDGKLIAVKGANQYSDDAARLCWQAESRAVEANHRAKLANQKEKSRDFTAEAMEPLREAYFRAAPSQRPQILARFVYLLTKK
jgi:hypothetical protein